MLKVQFSKAGKKGKNNGFALNSVDCCVDENFKKFRAAAVLSKNYTAK